MEEMLPPAMTAEEALLTLDGAAAAAPLNRRSHVLVQEAVTALATLLKVELVPGVSPLRPGKEEPPEPTGPTPDKK